MNAVGDVITVALIRSLWQDAIIAVALWLALRLLRRRSPNVRYVASCAALAGMVLWPVLSALSPAPALRVSGPSQQALPVATSIAVSSFAHAGWTAVASRDDVLVPIERWALPFWMFGVMLCSMRALGSGAHALVLARRGTPPDAAVLTTAATLAQRMGVTRRVRIIISKVSSGAATVGAWRPVILIPSAAMIGLTAQQLEAVIAHELAHIRRHDYAVNVMQVLIETVGFYHPAIWWASAQIRSERELCCDDLAVRCVGDPFGYAQALTALAVPSRGIARLALGVATGSLLHRVQRVLGASSDVRQSLPWSVLLVLSFVLAVGVIHPEWSRTRAVEPDATLSGFVYDPFEALVAGLPISIEAGPFQPSYFAKTTTDRSGHFVFDHLPAGRFVLTAPQSDFVQPLSVSLDAGASVERDVHMKIDTLAGEIIACATCASEPDSYRLPASLIEEFRHDREAAAKEPIQGVAPLGGWEFDQPHVFPYPPFLAPSIEGTAIVDGQIGSNGLPIALRVVSSPGEEISAAALAIVGEQRWEPARVQGVAVDVPFRMKVRFIHARQ